MGIAAENSMHNPEEVVAEKLRRSLPFLANTLADLAASDAIQALRDAGMVIFDPKQITRVEVIGDKVYSVWADKCAALVDGGRFAIFPYGEGLEAQGIYADKKLAEIKARQDQIVKAVAMCMAPDTVG